MSRGHPALWGTVAALPFVTGGYFLYASMGPYPQEIGVVFAVLGLFIALLGIYVEFMTAPSSPAFGDSEQEKDSFPPTQRVAKLKIMISIPFLVAGFYLLNFTMRPYIQPIVVLSIGWYLSFRGVYTYWRNSLTVYYITDQRVIRTYRFLSSTTKTVPVDMIRGTSADKSISEMLLGLGNVTVSSGTGSGLTIKLQNIKNPKKIEGTIRNEMEKYRDK